MDAFRFLAVKGSIPDVALHFLLQIKLRNFLIQLSIVVELVLDLGLDRGVEVLCVAFDSVKVHAFLMQIGHDEHLKRHVLLLVLYQESQSVQLVRVEWTVCIHLERAVQLKHVVVRVKYFFFSVVVDHARLDQVVAYLYHAVLEVHESVRETESSG